MVVENATHPIEPREYPGALIGHVTPVKSSQGGARYEAFCGRHIRQSKGRWRGKPLSFYPSQSAFHHELLRTVNGRRIYNEALYGLPRKNGKSTDAASLALYFLLADGEPAPEVYGAAGARDQAKIILEEAKRMVRQSPTLSEWCKIYRNEIVVPTLDGVYRAVSAEGGLAMGSNPSAVVCDELHVWKGEAGRELYNALTTGQDARLDPITVSITTAGYEKNSIAYDVFERGMTGEAELLFYWLGAIEGTDRLDDFEVWRRVNRAPWLTRKHWARQLRRNPLPVFARLHLNMWTATAAGWLPEGAWTACRGSERISVGERVWLGVDIGLRRDSTAIVEVAIRHDEHGVPRYIVRAYHFDPVESSGRVDFSAVEAKIKELALTRDVVELLYDPQFFHKSAEDLGELVRTVEVPPHNSRLAKPSQFMFDVIIDGALVHDGDEVLATHVKNVVVRETDYGWRMSKGKSKERIDSAYALMLALSGCMGTPGAEPGARPATPTPGNEVHERYADVQAKHLRGAIDRAQRAIYSGGAVECTTDEYRGGVRTGIQDYAGQCIDDGDEIRAVIALREVERLDKVHGSPDS